jgi:hypothetical protein
MPHESVSSRRADAKITCENQIAGMPGPDQMQGPPRNIVWIASYPKSGNTWVRFMACNLLFGQQNSAAAMNVLAPDIHEVGPQFGHGSHAGLVKTHFAYSSSLPLAERTAGAIYVVRRPEDVLVSNFHYANRSGGDANDSRTAFDQYFEAFMLHRGDPRWVRLGMGSWEENVMSWLGGAHPFPVVAIRYEDLSADPQRVCSGLAQLLRPGSSAADIAQAVDNSMFARMREIEEADIREERVGIFYKPYLQESVDAGLRFMRRGSVGEGAKRLTPEQRARLADVFAPTLKQLRYPSA